MRRFAVLDIGSNSLHMVCIEVDDDGLLRITDREREMLRLGSGTFTTRRIADERVEATVEAMRRFAALIRRWKVDEVLAVATSAVREAKNGEALLDAVAEATGLRVRLIDGPEEARLIWRGVTRAVDLRREKALIIDVGGGSVEWIVGDAARTHLAESLALGVLRLRDRCGDTDPFPASDAESLARHVQRTIARTLEKSRRIGFQRVLFTSGTLLSVSLAALRARGEESWVDIDGQRVTADEYRRLAESLWKLKLDERARVPGIDERRADTAPIAATLAATLLDALGVDEAQLSAATLREGLVVDHLAANGRALPDDIRKQSVDALLRRLGGNARHTHQLAVLATQLFDRLADLHQLPDDARELCWYAAQLSEAGQGFALARNESLPYHLIRSAGIHGFTRRELEVVALSVRYLRKGSPKPRHPQFSALAPDDRKLVRWIASLLRVAHGLDRGASGAVRALDVDVRRRSIEIVVHGDDVAVEVDSATRAAELLERTAERDIRVRAESARRT